MRHPHGYCVPRELLKRSLSLEEAYQLRPATPPRGIDCELLRAWHRATRNWETTILWFAVARERAGLHDLDERIVAGAPRQARRRTGPLPEAPGPLPPPAPAGPGPRRAAVADGAAGADLEARRRTESHLPVTLTIGEVAALGRVSVRAVGQYVFRTRLGHTRPGSCQYLPRAGRAEAGFARADVLDWLEARGQLGTLKVGNGGRMVPPTRAAAGRARRPVRSRLSAAAGGGT